MLAPAGKPLDDMSLLELEHAGLSDERGIGRGIAHSLASLGMFFALSVLCGVYVLHYEPKLIDNLRRSAITLALIVVTVGLAVLASATRTCGPSWCPWSCSA